MNPKHFQVICLMVNNNTTLTASNLACQLSVSIRTVMSYISDINFFHPALITSSHKGYHIDKEKARILITKYNQSSPQTAHERVNWLLKKLLLKTDSSEQINITNLSETLCVSPETIHKDLILLKKKIKLFNIQVKIITNHIYLNGSEVAIRSLLAQIIYETGNENKLCVASIHQIFPNAPVAEFYNLLLNECPKNNYFINDCLILNLILEILIAIDRIRQNHIIVKPLHQLPVKSISQCISQYAQKFYNITIPPVEDSYFQELLLGYLLPADFNRLSFSDLRERMPESHQHSFDIILKQIQHYLSFIDLNDRFLIRFALNLHNLVYRISTGHINYDPRKNTTKTASPFAFKCAVVIANKIQKLTGLNINEDTCAYLALHIGLNLCSKRDPNFEKISCALLITPYFDYDHDLKQNIQRIFTNDILITQTLSSEKELPQLRKNDLIITTVPLPLGFNTDWVSTDALLSTNVLQNISQHIMNKKLQKKRLLIQTFLEKFGSEILFKRTTKQYRLETIEQQAYTLLENNKCCHFDAAESKIKNHFTLFGHVAVPDIILDNVQKTSLVIIINEKPRTIDNTTIDIVLTLALHPNDWEITHYSFDLIINTLQKTDILQKIKKATTHHEFINCICQSILI